MSNPNLGNQLDAIFKPEWLAIVHGLEALAVHAGSDLQTALSAEQQALAAALNNAGTAVANARDKIDGLIIPMVNNGIEAFAKTIEASYPPFAPLVAASVSEVEALADSGTDAILLAVITRASSLLSNAGKTVAAIQLRNLVGAR